MKPKTLVVIGGGAAGCFCAVNAARMAPSLKVVVLEKTGRLLSKVRISGGGRCNVTHDLHDITEMSKRYPRGQHFVKKSFHRFFTGDTIAWFRERGVPLKAEADGRMFPVTDHSETIIECLLGEAGRYGVDIRMNHAVEAIRPAGEGFAVHLQGRASLQADFLCIATGGFPKSAQFGWILALGHTIAGPLPSLFTFNLPGHPLNALMGVSVPSARVRVAGSKLVEEGPVLVTHWGLSGPAVLRLSAWGAAELAERHYRFGIFVNWLPGETDISLKELFRLWRGQHPSRKLLNHVPPGLPARLWQFLLQSSGIDAGVRFTDLPAKLENSLIRNLVQFTAEVSGKTTFKEEFVTAGGVTLSEVDPQTMMSRKWPRLYFAGEVLNVDGITGGFNFQHAWTSGYLAAQDIAAQAV